MAAILTSDRFAKSDFANGEPSAGTRPVSKDAENGLNLEIVQQFVVAEVEVLGVLARA